MAKVNVRIPKGTKCNDGEICQQDLDLDLDIPDTKPVIQTIPQPEINIPNATTQMTTQIPAPQATAPPAPEIPQERTYTPDELADLMPSGVNFAVCKGKNCDDSKIKNKNFTTKFKECPKCRCNNVPIDSSICPCCGTDEPTDEEERQDYWESSDIELEA